jgi:hypothetical protein
MQSFSDADYLLITVYAENTPDTVPVSLVVQSAIRKLIEQLLVVARIVVIAMLWIIVLPLLLGAIFRGLNVALRSWSSLIAAVTPSYDNAAASLRTGYVILGSIFGLYFMYYQIKEVIVQVMDEVNLRNQLAEEDARDNRQNGQNVNDDDNMQLLADENAQNEANVFPGNAPIPAWPAVANGGVEPDPVEEGARVAAQPPINVRRIVPVAPIENDDDEDDDDDGDDEVALDDQGPVDLLDALGFRGNFSLMIELWLFVAATTLVVLVCCYFLFNNLGRIVLSLANQRSWWDTPSAIGAEISATLVGYTVVFAGLFTWIILNLLVQLISGAETGPVTRFILNYARKSGMFVRMVLLISLEILLFPLYWGIVLDRMLVPFAAHGTDDLWQLFWKFPFSYVASRWMAGIACMYHVAHFVIVLFDVIKPHVLRLIFRNPNDVDDFWVELLQAPAWKLVRRTVLSCIIGPTILWGMTWLPLTLSFKLFPFEQRRLHFDIESTFLDGTSSIALAQLLVFSILQNMQIMKYITVVVKWWCKQVVPWLGLQYWMLLSCPNADPAGNNSFAVDSVWKNVAWSKRLSLIVRLAMFIVLGWISLSVVLSVVVSLPIMAGRALIRGFGGLALGASSDIHAVLMGLVAIGLLFRVLHLFLQLTRPFWQRGNQPANTTPSSSEMSGRTTLSRILVLLALFILWCVVIPLLCGLCSEAWLLIPIKTRTWQSPFLRRGLDIWLLGFCHLSLCVFFFMHEDMRDALHRSLRGEARWEDVMEALSYGRRQVLGTLLKFLAVPHICCMVLFHTTGLNSHIYWCTILYRLSFPAFAIALVSWRLLRKLRKGYAAFNRAVRDEYYLRGEVLEDLRPAS